MRQSFRITREMAISHADFLRTLAAAFQGYSLEGDTVTIADSGKRVQVRLSPEVPRRIGSLCLPSTSVEFDFQGYTEDQVSLFMARFDAHFRRGGG